MFRCKLHILLIIIIALTFQSCSIFKKTAEEPKAEKRVDDFNFTSFFLEGARQKTLGNYEASIKNYSFAQKIDPNNATVYYEMAGVLSILGDFALAMENAEKAVELDKTNNIFYRILLASLYERNNLISKAAEIYENLVQIEPDNIQYYFELADIYLTIGNTKKAIASLNQAEKKFGVLDFISLEKEKIYNITGDKDKAIKEMENLVKSDPENVNYKVLLAESYVKNKLFEKANNTYDQVETMEIENGMIYFSMADFYRIIEDYDKTFYLLGKGFAYPDVDVNVKVSMMANIVANMGNDKYLYNNALKLAEILVIAHPENVEVKTLYTDFLIYENKYKEAQKEFDFILEKEKGKFVFWEQALFIDNSLSDYEAMYKRSSEAIQLFPNQPILYLFNVISAFMTENYDVVIKNAIKSNIIAINDQEMLIQILSFQADAYKKIDKHHQSDSVFEKILSMDPDNTMVLNNYSYYLSVRGEKLDDALKMSTKLISLDNSNAAYLDTHAWVLYKNNLFDESYKYILKAIEKNPENPVHFDHKGDILYKLSKKDEALEAWKKAKELGAESEILEKKIKEKTLIE